MDIHVCTHHFKTGFSHYLVLGLPSVQRLKTYLADLWWRQEMGDEPMPPDPVEMAERYFEATEEDFSTCLIKDGLGEVIEQAKELLWLAQLEQWPDSKRLCVREALATWNRGAISYALQYPAVVFYEVGTFRGIRYGLEPGEYISITK
jgi:hypothetical protein